ncbi:hypothetical protein BpHYR1_013890 [Brachionus plicatilis]|uniref:Uncharacterized protein n=1 Tax=Brachionus plicatilis TaxID=10195 RepID=A0A3M7QVT6_BRAPC|nr:hypothetical protein BpHYR1_013890 [Brachionus plicatilis]
MSAIKSRISRYWIQFDLFEFFEFVAQLLLKEQKLYVFAIDHHVSQAGFFLPNGFYETQGTTVYFVLGEEYSCFALSQDVQAIFDIAYFLSTFAQIFLNGLLMVIDARLKIDQIMLQMFCKCAWNTHTYFALFAIESYLLIRMIFAHDVFLVFELEY